MALEAPPLWLLYLDHSSEMGADAAAYLSTYFILFFLTHYESILLFYQPLFSPIYEPSYQSFGWNYTFSSLFRQFCYFIWSSVGPNALLHSSSNASRGILFFKYSPPTLLPVKKSKKRREKNHCMFYFRDCLLHVCVCDFFYTMKVFHPCCSGHFHSGVWWQMWVQYQKSAP